MLLGAFGTEIGRTGSPGRSSVGSSGPSSRPTQVAKDSSSGRESGSARYGHAPSPAHLVDDDPIGYQGAAGVAGQNVGWAGSIANSSDEDLLGGQEPSFISVVLSPRRTLRVINRD